MQKFYIPIIMICVFALAAPSLEAAAKEKPSFPDVTSKPKPNTQPVPVPYPNSATGPTHGPRSEPKYPILVPTVRHSGTTKNGTTKYIGETEKNMRR